MASVVKNLTQRAIAEVRRHPAGYVIIACFAVAGPFVARMVFPEAPDGVGLAGGVFLGIWAALCATPDKLMEE